jgi:P27 family predicted phage terminase small subunit
MTTKRALTAPKQLGPAGKALWRRMTREFDFNGAEVELLKQLCDTIDEIAVLKRELDATGPMVSGSKGQPVLNPVFTQLASHRKVADQLTTALALPLEGEAVGQRRSARSKVAADARWRRTKSRGRLGVVGANLSKGGA